MPYPVSDCVEMYQNGQDENVAFFWHQICRGTRLGASEPLTTARDTKNMDQKAFFSLWMPRRKSPIFKLPVLIQFQVAADNISATNPPTKIRLEMPPQNFCAARIPTGKFGYSLTTVSDRSWSTAWSLPLMGSHLYRASAPLLLGATNSDIMATITKHRQSAPEGFNTRPSWAPSGVCGVHKLFPVL